MALDLRKAVNVASGQTLRHCSEIARRLLPSAISDRCPPVGRPSSTDFGRSSPDVGNPLVSNAGHCWPTSALLGRIRLPTLVEMTPGSWRGVLDQVWRVWPEASVAEGRWARRSSGTSPPPGRPQARCPWGAWGARDRAQERRANGWRSRGARPRFTGATGALIGRRWVVAQAPLAARDWAKLGPELSLSRISRSDRTRLRSPKVGADASPKHHTRVGRSGAKLGHPSGNAGRCRPELPNLADPVKLPRGRKRGHTRSQLCPQSHRIQAKLWPMLPTNTFSEIGQASVGPELPRFRPDAVMFGLIRLELAHSQPNLARKVMSANVV